jgi:hypothetical protein
MFLERKDIRRKGPFPCPCCHKLLRARQSKLSRFVSGFVAVVGGLFSILGIRYGSHAIRDAGGLTVLLCGAFDLVFRLVSQSMEIEPAEDSRLVFR